MEQAKKEDEHNQIKKPTEEELKIYEFRKYQLKQFEKG
jgi:hypothetical protein